MFTIFKKELHTFFSSITGYLVIGVFLLVNAWFLWIGRSAMNILDGGFASLSGLFELAPWLFLFLLPAIAMRTLADEKKSGTIELLLAQPLTERRLILGKYFATVAVAWLSLLPTLVYFGSLYLLGQPAGNIDTGGTWGSYAGLLLLAAGYAAIGLLASSLTDNQIIAFLLAAAGCFFFYLGFDGLSALLPAADRFLMALGINERYRSMSRGVIDLRDVLYFVSLIALFLEAARLQLKSGGRRCSSRRGALPAVRLTALAAGLLLINFAVANAVFRIDLTADRRYTLSEASQRVMQRIAKPLLIAVYLDGDMPVEMKRLRATIKETIDELRVYAPGKVHYKFINIAADVPPEALDNAFRALYERGLAPVVIEERAADGSRSERTLFPGAIIAYPNPDNAEAEWLEMPVNFLQSNADADSDQSLLVAEQNVETALVAAIAHSARTHTPRIAFVEGHGELDEYETGDICKELATFARLDRVLINGDADALDGYAAVVVARPTQPWDEADKLAIDQYIMRGGRVAWFIDAVDVHHDSLAAGRNTFALAANHRLDDQLFKYGVRINPVVISDLQCALLPVNIAPAGQTADFRPAPWTYYPLLTPPATHPITSGLNLIESKYPSTVDTVGRTAAVTKTVLLASSPHSRIQTVPALVSLAESMHQPDPAHYRLSSLPIALLLEGCFPSAFQNRPLQGYNHGRPFVFIPRSDTTKMIVVADGDIIRNNIIRRPDGIRIFPLGFDNYMKIQFGNRAFVKNALSCLLDDDNVLQIRRREWTLRMLDKTKTFRERHFWVALNSILPVALTLIAGLLFNGIRKNRWKTFRRKTFRRKTFRRKTFRQ
ncbi:MAG: gliding motility-associated ABC transporter substrate-binding protein GldG [Prevotellaceae bacterium]|jgi:ABC-2 type transport system permease protein|nr:gliding motility-associated ABC transporter substrate-binding protein GldG [Prevotellaceae bacterium]